MNEEKQGNGVTRNRQRAKNRKGDSFLETEESVEGGREKAKSQKKKKKTGKGGEKPENILQTRRKPLTEKKSGLQLLLCGWGEKRGKSIPFIGRFISILRELGRTGDSDSYQSRQQRHRKESSCLPEGTNAINNGNWGR